MKPQNLLNLLYTSKQNNEVCGSIWSQWNVACGHFLQLAYGTLAAATEVLWDASLYVYCRTNLFRSNVFRACFDTLPIVQFRQVTATNSQQNSLHIVHYLCCEQAHDWIYNTLIIYVILQDRFGASALSS